MVKILAFSGSTRKGSFNKKMVAKAAAAARVSGAEVTLIDLADFPMPLYDGDLEEKEGIPLNGKRLKKIFLEHDALMIASPEYNSSISAVLKNAIDWVSRPEKTDTMFLSAFQNKVALIMSASLSDMGGIRGLVHLRSILGNICMLVLPEQVLIRKAHEAFKENGDLQDSKKQEEIEGVVKKLVSITHSLIKNG